MKRATDTSGRRWCGGQGQAFSTTPGPQNVGFFPSTASVSTTQGPGNWAEIRECGTWGSVRVELGCKPQDRHRHWLHPVCAWLALLLPLLVTLWRASTGTQWRDDLAIVRGLGLVPLAGEGTVSSVFMQLFALLPIGGRLLRASLASAVALALAARLLYTLSVRLLDENAWTPRLSPALALAAALTATLSPPGSSRAPSPAAPRWRPPWCCSA